MDHPSSAGRRRPAVWFSAVALLHVVAAGSTDAAVTTTGVVTPTDPAEWPSSTLIVGPSAYGSLAVDGGSGIASAAGYVAANGGGSGDVDVTGPGSSWTMTGNLVVGNAGPGTLEILDGAVVSNASAAITGGGAAATGTVTVNAATWTNSLNLNIGSIGAGTLNVENGGLVTSTGTSNLSNAASVNIGGAGSSWSAGSVRFAGVTEVSGGGALALTGTADIARATGSIGSVTISGTGSTFAAASMFVGNAGVGSFEVNNGATATVGGGIIGGSVGAHGAVTIDGPGSTWTTTGVLAVGNEGIGTLSLANGGKFIAGNNVAIGSLGAVDVAGGVMDMAGRAVTFATGAELRLTAGRLQHASTIGTVAAQYDLVQTGGTLAAGVSAANSIGTTTIHGGYTLGDAGVLEVELGGSATPEFDQYQVTGVAVLEGMLDVIVLGDFVPVQDQTFDVLTALTIDATDLSVESGYEFAVVSGGNGQILRLTVVPEPASAALLALGLGLIVPRRRRMS